MKNKKKGWKDIGKMMSDNYEFFECIKDVLGLCGSDNELINFIKERDLIERDFYIKTTHEKPLGSEFLRKIYDEIDPLSLIVKAHLFVENFLDEIIRIKFRNSQLILDRRDFTFSLKLDILRSKNYLDEKLYSDIMLLNKLRNKFAHDLFYDISDFDMSKFYYCDGFYDKVKTNSKEAKRVLNIHILRIVLCQLLFRLTKKYPFISDIKIKK
ncbi:MAG: hypothetical protein OIN85_09600 [Candidatus Methanoperedens sp.]|nr:hypothetical protein [Candidatus Methanoperedens sp.]